MKTITKIRFISAWLEKLLLPVFISIMFYAIQNASDGKAREIGAIM